MDTRKPVIVDQTTLDWEPPLARHDARCQARDTREGVPLEARNPFVAVRPTSPAGLPLFHHTRGGFGEGRHALRAMLLRERVTTLTRQLAVGQCLLPRLGEADQRDAAEPELAAPAADHQALNPAPGSAARARRGESRRGTDARGSSHSPLAFTSGRANAIAGQEVRRRLRKKRIAAALVHVVPNPVEAGLRRLGPVRAAPADGRWVRRHRR